MNAYLENLSFRISFETMLEKVRESFRTAGFNLYTEIDLQRDYSEQTGLHTGRHVVVPLTLPRVYSEMLSIRPLSGGILPCSIAVVERYPGDVMVVPCNPTLWLAELIRDDRLRDLALQVNTEIMNVLKLIPVKSETDPDVVTSWD